MKTMTCEDGHECDTIFIDGDLQFLNYLISYL